MYEQFQIMGISDVWNLKVIQGYVGQRDLHVEGRALSLVLISRRRVTRGGVDDIGIDDDLHLGNDVETE